MEDIRAKAERRGEAIIKERQAEAENAVNTLKQDSQRAVVTISSRAQQNAGRARQKAIELFSQEYLDV